jgi:hypothetical protein
MGVIEDGKGTGKKAKVNADNQLITRATAVEQRLTSAVDGNYYEVTTGLITITTATEQGMLYLKNTADLGIVIDRVFFDFWTSAGGTDQDITIGYYRNPTITGGTDVTPFNTNFSSGTASSAIGEFKRNTTTMTGDHWWYMYASDKTSIAIDEGRIYIPSGYSFGIAMEPPTGNTSMKININIAFYYFDEALIQ